MENKYIERAPVASVKAPEAAMPNAVTTVRIKGTVVGNDTRDGTLTIEVPAPRSLTAKEFQFLESIFPNTMVRVERLLAQEALLNAVV